MELTSQILLTLVGATFTALLVDMKTTLCVGVASRQEY